ncbi:MAG: CvpA family protein [Chitinophagales bacterium]|nr:CvpA family protein [Chitinophagales bacterium]
MWIDILLLAVLVLAFIMGFWKGFVHSVISFFALIIGGMVAIKFSGCATQKLYEWFGWQGKLMPILSFILLFICALLLLRLITVLLEKSLKTAGLGVVNQLAGSFLWCISLLMILSIVLWYVNKLQWIDERDKIESRTYNYLQPAAPIVMDQFGKLIPWFKGAFDQLEETMDQVKEGKNNA